MTIIIISFIITVAGLSSIMVKNNSWQIVNLWPAFLLLIANVTVYNFLRKWRPKADCLILSLTSVLLAVGFVFIYRLQPSLLPYQAIWFAISIIVFAIISLKKNIIFFFKNYQYISGIVGVALLMTATLFGVDIGGHRDWVVIGPLRFQPAEFSKILLVGFFAAWLAERRNLLREVNLRFLGVRWPQPKLIGPLIVIWVLTIIMLMFQRDLGSSLIYFATAFIMIYIASGRSIYLSIGAIAFFVSSAVCYRLYSHIKVRVDIWLNPWIDPDGKSFQLVQSIFAFGTGGMLGTGLGFGNPKAIPEVHTDFILAAIAEEMGYFAVVSILLIYAAIFYRGIKIAADSKNAYSALLAIGTVICISLQAILIIGGVTGFLPLTGVTLPLVSYGGSSMLTIFIFLALLTNISEENANVGR